MELLQAARREEEALVRKIEASFVEQDERYAARRKRDNLSDQTELRSDHSLSQRRTLSFLKKR